jgi:chorismate mutase / prephenate dehydratase
MSEEKPSLDALRVEIDEIDNQLHDLIMERSKIIERVRHAKAGDRVKIRPAREAEILYRLSDRHEGVFPKQSLFRMWREMIVGTLALEAPFAVGVQTVVTGSGSGEDGYADLARDHFGSFSNLHRHQSAAAVIEMVNSGEVTVGVLPFPQPDSDNVWWHHLANDDDQRPMIMGRLPFFGRSNATGANLDALVISSVKPEPSSRDISVYSLDVTGEISIARLRSEIEAQEFEPGIVFQWTHPVDTEHRHFLVELDGFVPADDPRLVALGVRLEGALAKNFWLGTYSAPIEDQELENGSGPRS